MAPTVSGLAVPTCFGIHKTFNYTTRSCTSHILARLILHNSLTLQDVELDWETPRRLKVRVAWPEWFQMAEQMAQFTLDEEGLMIFPPEHELIMDTAVRNQDLVEEDGRIWDEGMLAFDQDMKSDLPAAEVLEVEIPSKNTSVTVLQLYME